MLAIYLCVCLQIEILESINILDFKYILHDHPKIKTSRSDVVQIWSFVRIYTNLCWPYLCIYLQIELLECISFLNLDVLDHVR
jgi:hypothetical protein